MGMYKHIRNLWKKPKSSLGDLWKERLIKWRREEATVKLKRPTRLDRARSLGYKAKPGIFVVRQRVMRGGHTRPKWSGGRRSKHSSRRLTLEKSYQNIAEERVQRKYKNMVVLNSYWVAKDGKYYWYEIILIDPDHPVIKKDPKYAWLQKKKNRKRVYHGKTSAGKKIRGLRKKGKGAEKVRPSRARLNKKKKK